VVLLLAAAAPSINAQSKKPYRGIDILSLWAATEEADSTRICGQPTNNGRNWEPTSGKQRKTLVVFWKFSDLVIDEGSKAEEREEESRRSILARGYWVFNADQVDGFTPPEMPTSRNCKGSDG
jgi:antirestriction protein ArdC